MSTLTWDGTQGRIVADIQARWRLMATVVFDGLERRSVLTSEVLPTPQDIIAWTSCSGPPSAVLPNGATFELQEGVVPRTVAFVPLHSNGAKCQPPGVATAGFATTTESNQDQAQGLVSAAYKFITTSGETIQVVIAIRDEGGNGGDPRTLSDRTNEILKKLGLTIRVTPGGHVVVNPN
ncbi:MAG TPA: hypothetical protein VNA88_16365 [Candidatus Kapabacteria bacterium]|nr:hypothetical protein [Candidatus Kapabacteria bacterium]